ncbi:hypothetical protein J2X69_002148 [Algoriphagus sp. 4150]|uniref:hypothetical protein n=1 Tax=Algoriphagus sp. 4150 TaxID=2817756 RepID=UPI0028649EF7|nr:hypothetical protein [Algoriphagus sp. 4150]MDR7129802.1 hypothetical protein [Algoriphagus sp. 4150]
MKVQIGSCFWKSRITWKPIVETRLAAGMIKQCVTQTAAGGTPTAGRLLQENHY